MLITTELWKMKKTKKFVNNKIKTKQTLEKFQPFSTILIP